MEPNVMLDVLEEGHRIEHIRTHRILARATGLDDPFEGRDTPEHCFLVQKLEEGYKPYAECVPLLLKENELSSHLPKTSHYFNDDGSFTPHVSACIKKLKLIHAKDRDDDVEAYPSTPTSPHSSNSSASGVQFTAHLHSSKITVMLSFATCA